MTCRAITPLGRPGDWRFVLLALAGLAAAAPAAEEEVIERRLEYAVRVWKGVRAVGRTVGSVTVDFGTTAYDGRRCRLLRVRTQASVLGLTVDATTDSCFHPATGRQLGFHYLRTGSRTVESQLRFGPDEIQYLKQMPAEQGDTTEWRLLARHPYDPAVCDMMSAFYRGRVKGMAVGGEPRTLRCVADHKLWDVAFHAVGRETVTVPAGTFETLRLEIKPSPANDYTKELAFRGPFALGPDTRFWVEPETGTLVKLSGTAHLRLALRSEMRLVRISDPRAQADDAK